jgi:hypothetical protein
VGPCVPPYLRVAAGGRGTCTWSWEGARLNCSDLSDLVTVAPSPTATAPSGGAFAEVDRPAEPAIPPALPAALALPFPLGSE